MSDFLTFLNSADTDTLTKTPGITRTLAESLIAARPFATADDCLNVRGMGPNLLSRMQSGFTTQEKEPPDPAHVASEEEAHPAPVTAGRAESDPNASKPEATGSRFGTVALNVLRAFLRFVALAIVLAGLVALVYYGAPYIRNNFIAPVEENTARIQALNDQIAALKEQSATLQAQLDETRGRVDALEQSIAAHTASLEKLAEAQSALETQMQGTDAQLRADMQAGDEALLRKLKRDVMLTRVIEYLSRARLYLSQSNFGLAR